MDPQERHYDSNKLTKIFAISSVILLATILWMFAADYDREWKKYQKEFLALEVEKARVKYDKASLDLEANSEYNALKDELKKAQDDYAANCTDVGISDEEMEALRAENDLTNQQYKFTKAELDAAKYRFESGEAHHGKNVEQARQEFLALAKKTADLKLTLEDSNKRLGEKEQVVKDCGKQVAELERKERKLTAQKSLFERKLEKIDRAEMSIANQIADAVRDLPVIDLANPNIRLDDKQIVLKDIRDDVNFMTVPKVERCTACHLGITNPDYVDAVQPYRTHPNLDQYVGKDSPHPVEEFGCTVCHGGRPRATDFYGSVHTPSTPQQKKEWKEKYGWKHFDLWEEPMYPLTYVEAGCFKCHSGEGAIKGADKLNLGMQVIEQAGCYNCHDIDKYEGWPKSGPNLTKVATKVTKEWAYRWIDDPKSFRHDAWMPSYYHQSNNSDPESKARGEQEIHAIVHYLFNNSSEYVMEKVPKGGKLERGEELVASLGCFACHQVQPDPSDNPTTRDTLRREFGPNLIGLGSKTTKEWLYNWLKNPPSYHPETRMPNMRLTDEEAVDITEYLYASKLPSFDQKQIPAQNQTIIDDIVFKFLTKMETNQAAKARLGEMTLDEKLTMAGEKLIGQYGCYSCHDIDGFEGRKPIGIELTEEGSKSLHNLAFGFVHIDHTKHAWFTQKLKDPRIFDKGKVLEPDAKLMMPNFYLSKEEVEAVTTALLGFVKDVSVQSKIKPRTTENLYVEEGQKIIAQLNCQGCHMIEDDGGTIQESIKNWLVQYKDRSENEADKVVESYSPPNLYGVGAKLDPQWLFNFLHEPSTVRPWLNVRMPTYTFNAAHLNTLVTYFNTLDKEEYPFYDEVDTSLSKNEYAAAEKMFSTEYFGCTQCHVVGDQLPSGEPDAWAPDLSLGKTRLKPGWLYEWIKDPAQLMPGTKMPTFYDPGDFENSGPPDILDGDENEQIRVLRNFLMNLADEDPKKRSKSSPAPAETTQ